MEFDDHRTFWEARLWGLETHLGIKSIKLEQQGGEYPL
jgi:hypothetical protein